MRRSRVLTVVTGCLVLGLVGLLAGGEASPGASRSQTDEPLTSLADARERLHGLVSPPPTDAATSEGAPRRPDKGCEVTGDPVRHTDPAEILTMDLSPSVSSSVFWPVLNAWHVSNHRMRTIVYAGGGVLDDSPSGGRSVGRFVIIRRSFVCLDEVGFKIVDVPDAGPVKITRAPEGRGSVQTRAQKRGRLLFEGRRGVTGVLRLKDDQVVLK